MIKGVLNCKRFHWNFILINDLCSLVKLIITIPLSRTYVWEIMHSTIRKMNMHVKKVEMELVDIEDKNKFAFKVQIMNIMLFAITHTNWGLGYDP